MTLTTEEQALISDIRDVLTERLLYNRTWDNVRIKIKRTYIEIIWFNHKTYDDPRGAIYEERKRISPLNVTRLRDVLTRQKRNLVLDHKEDAKHDVGREDVG